MISLKNISKTYKSGKGSAKALRNISLDLRPGEFVAIMGPSGSGKSTLLSILGALEVPDGGNYHFFGENVFSENDERISSFRAMDLGFIFQSFHLLPRLSILQNVMLSSLYARVPPHIREERALRAFAMAELPKKLGRRFPHELSGGEMQRAAIARGIVNTPRLILADEPTGNLDSRTALSVMRTFKKIHTEQKSSIVLVTHDPSIARFADRIIFLKDGRISKK